MKEKIEFFETEKVQACNSLSQLELEQAKMKKEQVSFQNALQLKESELKDRQGNIPLFMQVFG